MKKISIALLMALFSAAGAFAQQIIKGEEMGGFTAVNLSGNMSVEMIHSDTVGIRMELNGVDSKSITWGVSEGVLNVKVRSGMVKGAGRLMVRVWYNDVRSVVSNGADVLFSNLLSTTMFSAAISSGAKFTATIDCLDFELKLTGNSAAQLSGKSKYLSIAANQASKVNAGELESQSVNAKADISSEISMFGVERVVAESNTGSVIFYRGDPVVLKTSTRMSGSIHNVGAK